MTQAGRSAFEVAFDVPRGTIALFDRYAELLTEWQQRMNLVGPSTIEDLWTRHFTDSAQLMRHTPKGKNWLDIGAGGGFPGLVLAIFDWGQFTLVDSIGKKCRFLEAVAEELGLRNVTIINKRIEDLPALHPDIITARATAALDRLLDWSLPHARRDSFYVFPKGRNWKTEILGAKNRFRFDFEAQPSMTDEDAHILLLRNVKRR